jgi:restriction endonuclease XhoI-like protein
MAADISALEKYSAEAVKDFWRSRLDAGERQAARGVTDQGNRGNVTAGKNLAGFTQLVQHLITDNGIGEVEVFTEGRVEVTLPGFYRATKQWDLLVVSKSQLVAAVEFKSQVGPSFGNNFNNRVEEALGNATDLLTAFKAGVFGQSSRPFLGYFFVLEECEDSLSSVAFKSPHFPAMKEFTSTSYAQRYEILCKKLVQEQLYDAAALALTKREAVDTGEYRCISKMTSAKRFAATLAGKVSGMALESPPSK